ncbi:BRCA1-A complex subunit BRE [Entomortierella parvispora]|uniref:BRISC and BRCA1-A complex member 2 n=1 Tax=Entomortierella parvispora TaxID=205924 RepID=A0A9P3M2K0_9FUNG|nr:BRCA1-A complex subunit BRE [Entomortierella parvispora]
MTVYSTSKGSHYLMSQTLSQSIQYLGENATMNLFSVKNVNLGSSQTVFNPDGRPIADTVQLSMRSSSIGSNSVDLQFFYDPYDWSFPPDLIINGQLIKPSLQDLGLDDSWDKNDPANLSSVLGKLSRMMQHGERERVAHCENERIQVEYSCLHDMTEMDCCLIPGVDGPTKVLFAVPFHVPYTQEGKKRRLKVVAKIQYFISSLMPNDVSNAKSRLETLSSFEYPEILEAIPDIGQQEHIVDFVERVTRKVSDHFQRKEKLGQMKKEFIEATIKTFRPCLIEYDDEDYKQASFLLIVPKEGRGDQGSTAIATFSLPDAFPDEYPKVTLSSPYMPFDSFLSPPAPESIKIEKYSPRWGVDRMITEIWEQLWFEIPRFHNRSYKASIAPTIH